MLGLKVRLASAPTPFYVGGYKFANSPCRGHPFANRMGIGGLLTHPVVGIYLLTEPDKSGNRFVISP